MIDMDWHEAACLFPMMTDREIEELAEDIKNNGLRTPILLLSGAILDGRNRYRACQIAGVEPKFDYADGRRIGDPFVYVASLNLRRRHLTESQRAVVGARMKEHFAALAKERQTASLKQNAGETVSQNLGERGKASEQAASLVNVSRGSIESASRVLERGAPELVAAVERGDVAVSAAAEVARLPLETQRAAVAEGTVPKLAKDQREARKAKPVEPEDSDAESFDAPISRAPETTRDAEEASISARAISSILERAMVVVFEQSHRVRGFLLDENDAGRLRVAVSNVRQAFDELEANLGAQQ